MKPRIVVTQGDLGGIAPEVLLHCLADSEARESCSPLILGHIGYLKDVAARDDDSFISTCSYCRKAKDTEGNWSHLDQYLSARTNLNFSHGICDSCIEVHFPDVLEVWEAEKKEKVLQNQAP